MRPALRRIPALIIALMIICSAAPASANISVWWWGDDIVNQKTLNALTEYTKRYRGTLIEATYYGGDVYERALSERIKSGGAPDIMQVRAEWLTQYEFTASGAYAFSDLNRFHNALELDELEALALKCVTVNGRLAAMPLALDGRVFLWNMSAFALAGMAPPMTYAGLLNAGGAFRLFLGEGHYPLSLNALERVTLIVYYLQSRYGRDWIDADAKRLCFTPSEIAEGMDIILALESAHAMPRLADMSKDGWKTGAYAGSFAWDCDVTELAATLPKGDTAAIGGYFPDFGVFGGGFAKVTYALAIAERSPYKKDAARIIGFLTSGENGASAMGDSRGVPLSEAAMDIYAVRKQLDAFELEAESVMRDHVRFAMDPWFERDELAGDNGVYYSVMNALSDGRITSAEAAERLHGEISAFISRRPDTRP